MAANDEISSTEKLLDVIRDDDAGISAADGSGTGSVKKRKRKSPMKKGMVVGVDIGYNAVRLVKMTKKKQLLDVLTVPYPPDVTREAPDFLPFMKSALSGFVGRDSEVWCSVPTAGVEIRYLRIPRLSRKQVNNAVFWTFKKETPFNEKEMVFDYEILGDIIEDGVKKTEVLAYVAPTTDIDEITELFAKCGYPLTGVTAIPLAFQNLLRNDWIPGKDTELCNLYIGRNWSRIDVFSQGNLVLSRGIKSGMNSMIEAVKEGVNAKRQEQSGEIVIQLDEPAPSDEPETGGPINTAQARDIFMGLVGAGSGTETGGEFAPGELFDMVQTAADRLVRQIERTLEHYLQNLKGGSVTKVYATGQVSAYEQLMSYIRRQLGVEVEGIDPISPGEGTMPRGFTPPQSNVERAAFAPAVGLALSDPAYTPNLIFTYLDKDKIAEAKAALKIVFGSFFIIMLLLGGYYFWQSNILAGKEAQAAQLQKELDRFVPNVNQDILLKVIGIIKKNQNTLDEYGKRFRGMAAISELSSMTPSNIRLMNVTADFGSIKEVVNPKDKESKPEKKIEYRGKLLLEGMVTGNRRSIETSLAQYLLRLQVSPLFGRPTIKEQTFRLFEGNEIMLFSAEVIII